jgi:hypothetical protein
MKGIEVFFIIIISFWGRKFPRMFLRYFYSKIDALNFVWDFWIQICIMHQKLGELSKLIYFDGFGSQIEKCQNNLTKNYFFFLENFNFWPKIFRTQHIYDENTQKLFYTLHICTKKVWYASIRWNYIYKKFLGKGSSKKLGCALSDFYEMINVFQVHAYSPIININNFYIFEVEIFLSKVIFHFRKFFSFILIRTFSKHNEAYFQEFLFYKKF